MEKDFLSNCLMRLQTWQRIVLGVGKMEVSVRMDADDAYLTVTLIRGEQVTRHTISGEYMEESKLYMKEIENKLHEYGWY